MANDETSSTLLSQIANLLYNLGQGCELSGEERKRCSDFAKQFDDRMRAARAMETRGLRLVLMPKLNEEYTTESGSQTVNVTQLIFDETDPDGFVFYDPGEGEETLELFLAKFTKKATGE